jgi:hypothetical protein
VNLVVRCEEALSRTVDDVVMDRELTALVGGL